MAKWAKKKIKSVETVFDKDARTSKVLILVDDVDHKLEISGDDAPLIATTLTAAIRKMPVDIETRGERDAVISKLKVRFY